FAIAIGKLLAIRSADAAGSPFVVAYRTISVARFRSAFSLSWLLIAMSASYLCCGAGKSDDSPRIALGSASARLIILAPWISMVSMIASSARSASRIFVDNSASRFNRSSVESACSSSAIASTSDRTAAINWFLCSQAVTLEEVLIGTDRAAKLTSQLLSFSRRQIMENRVFRVEDSISEIKDLLRKSTGERYKLDVKNFAEGACVETDASEFQQALINLVVNARDAMPKGGLIEITSRIVELDEAAAKARANLSPGRFIEVSVRDNGEGMTEKTAAHIFEPFFTTKEPGKGTGLGLAMVYGFAQSSKGSVEVDSAPNKGANFKIYLPAVDRIPQINIAEIEHDPALLEIVREILDTLGYDILTACDGFDALEVEADHAGTIDLILSDVVMPNMDGFEAADIIRGDYPDIKIVFMSDYPNRAGISTDKLPDNCQFLQKPVKPEYLARILRQELDKPSPPSLDLPAEEGTYDHA
ncbi:MAG: response regulator, partial [Alphaproteobacteria bacterium]|nr:response regulator [Alphaproteobacteria bacterium]